MNKRVMISFWFYWTCHRKQRNREEKERDWGREEGSEEREKEKRKGGDGKWKRKQKEAPWKKEDWEKRRRNGIRRSPNSAS